MSETKNKVQIIGESAPIVTETKPKVANVKLKQQPLPDLTGLSSKEIKAKAKEVAAGILNFSNPAEVFLKAHDQGTFIGEIKAAAKGKLSEGVAEALDQAEANNELLVDGTTRRVKVKTEFGTVVLAQETVNKYPFEDDKSFRDLVLKIDNAITAETEAAAAVKVLETQLAEKKAALRKTMKPTSTSVKNIVRVG